MANKKFFRWVENTVRKGEIARYEQFLLFPECFKGLVPRTRKNMGLFGKRVNPFSQKYSKFKKNQFL